MPDLIQLCNEWRRFARCHDHLYDRAGPLEEVDEERYDMLQALAQQDIHDRKMVPLAQRIADRPATSWAGVAENAAGILASDSLCSAYAASILSAGFGRPRP